jgi:hypothetical protein
MNDHARRRLDAETAEQLLTGQSVSAPGFGQLADRLSAASAGAFPGELAGADAALAAFRTATDVELAPTVRRSSLLKSALVAKLATLKVAAVAFAAVSAGGVALAASTGVLPNPLAPQTPAHSTPTPAHTNGSDATPSPSLVGLCQAYLSGVGNADGHALENPAFAALLNAAGGEENVTTYCASIGVTEPGPGHETGGPTDGPGAASDLPTPSHPTGATPSHPTPTTPSHPTGASDTLPTPSSHP